MITTTCLCNTSTRPPVNDLGLCPKCALPRAPRAEGCNRRLNKPRQTRDDRIAAHIDGYDRDDIGLSPDF